MIKRVISDIITVFVIGYIFWPLWVLPAIFIKILVFNS